MMINEKSVRTIVKKRLKLRSYKHGDGHFISEAMTRNRLKKCRKLLRLRNFGTVLFTDEKIFTVKRTRNHQNDRQLLRNRGVKFSALLEYQKKFEKKVVPHSHFPQSIMVWAGITATGKTPLVFKERGVKINAAEYQKQFLNKVVKPWARRHFNIQCWTFQHDWALAHSAKTTLAYCKNEFPDMWDRDLWPSNSPDLNPMDYSVWVSWTEKPTLPITSQLKP